MTLTFDPRTITVDDLASRHRRRLLNLQPAFQRQSVWTPRDRSKLAESVLFGYPIPSIFFHVRQGPRGASIYDVIDGKQRIESILAFMNTKEFNHWEYIRAYSPGPDGAPIQTEWLEMTNEQKHRFREYKIQAVEVSGNIGEVIDLFVKINSTGRSLSTAETRNARFYESPLLKKAKDLSHSWSGDLAAWKVISPAQSSRMKDIELMTELLLAVHQGGPLNKKASLDAVLEREALSTDAIAAAAKELVRALKGINGVLPRIKETRFHRLADFYTLVVLIAKLQKQGAIINGAASEKNREATLLLTAFSNEVDRLSQQTRQLKAPSSSDEFIASYLRTVKEGTDRQDQRQMREGILKDVLSGVFDRRDSRRSFNAAQRRIVWNSSSHHRCGICLKEIRSFDEMQVDHIEPHSRGGKTTLTNAQLSHATCNRSKGAA